MYLAGLIAVAGIHSAGNRVRYTMNGFLISVGSYVPPLTADAEYIQKVKAKGTLGKKKKTVKC